MNNESVDPQLRSASNEMMRNIDYQILSETLVESGWTRIRIDYVPEHDQYWYLVKNWADENFVGQHQEHRGVWLIENPVDATAFALRWKTK